MKMKNNNVTHHNLEKLSIQLPITISRLACCGFTVSSVCFHAHIYIYLNVRSTIKNGVQLVNQEKLVVVIAGYITLACNQQ